MKRGLLYILSIIIFSCSNPPVDKAKIIEIDVVYEESTGSLDAIISDKNFEYPDSIKQKLPNPSSRDILLEGKNPYLKSGSFFEIFTDQITLNKYKLKGYFTRVDTASLSEYGKAAVFFVLDYSKIPLK